jgi:molecular chaperone DnaK (HSP70)
MTYERMAELTGRTYEGARQLVAKKRLPTRKRNEPPQKTEVLVDIDAPGIRRIKSVDTSPDVEDDASLDLSPNHAGELIDHLRGELAYARAELERQRADHTDERDCLRADHRAELERLKEDVERTRLEADRWRDDADREREHVRAMFDQLKAMADQLAQLHRERQDDAEVKANLMADVNHLTIELDHARRRWWHRLIGRR